MPNRKTYGKAHEQTANYSTSSKTTYVGENSPWVWWFSFPSHSKQNLLIGSFVKSAGAIVRLHPKHIPKVPLSTLDNAPRSSSRMGSLRNAISAWISRVAGNTEVTAIWGNSRSYASRRWLTSRETIDCNAVESNGLG